VQRIPIRGISSRSPVDGQEDEKPWLFEPLAHNPLREPARGSDFFHAQPIEKARFGKENERK
jgi:hypothetical protein